MPTLRVLPCAQVHRWNLYMNSPSFTSTTMLDEFRVDVRSSDAVRGVFASVAAHASRDFSKDRRVEGFEETWLKVIHRGQELDPGLTWDETGIRGDGGDEAEITVSVVWKELVAEGFKVCINEMDDISSDEDVDWFGDSHDVEAPDFAAH